MVRLAAGRLAGGELSADACVPTSVPACPQPSEPIPSYACAATPITRSRPVLDLRPTPSVPRACLWYPPPAAGLSAARPGRSSHAPSTSATPSRHIPTHPPLVTNIHIAIQHLFLGVNSHGCSSFALSGDGTIQSNNLYRDEMPVGFVRS